MIPARPSSVYIGQGIFLGAGEDACQTASHLQDPGQMALVSPIQRAYALLPDEF